MNYYRLHTGNGNGSMNIQCYIWIFICSFAFPFYDRAFYDKRNSFGLPNVIVHFGLCELPRQCSICRHIHELHLSLETTFLWPMCTVLQERFYCICVRIAVKFYISYRWSAGRGGRSCRNRSCAWNSSQLGRTLRYSWTHAVSFPIRYPYYAFEPLKRSSIKFENVKKYVC